MDERSTEDVELLIDSLTRDLIEEFEDRVAPQDVERLVTESYRAYSNSRIQTYVPILVRREARARLRRVATQQAS